MNSIFTDFVDVSKMNFAGKILTAYDEIKDVYKTKHLNQRRGVFFQVDVTYYIFGRKCLQRQSV
jgi:hypothetical protein